MIGGVVINYYKSFTNDLNYIYSLDMVRYNFELIDDCLKKFLEFINTYNLIYGCNVKFYTSKSGLGYKYLYNITIEDNTNKCSFAIGFGLNSKSENMNKGFIEFNPNKCYMLSQFENFFFQFTELCCSLTLVRYDCAIDIPLPRNKVKLIRNYRCNYEYLIESTKAGQVLNKSVTEYQGRRNCNKFTKLYDKKAESHLDYDLTRIEFTFDRDETIFKNLPNFFVYDPNIINNFNFSDISASDLVLIDLLRNSPEINYYLKNLPYRKRKKIEPYLSDLVLQLDNNLLLSIRDLALSFEF